jgi:CRP-like cAMP-binding protein
MPNQTIWFQENMNLENIFCPDANESESHLSKKLEFKKGDFIYLPADNSDKIFLILSGKIKIGNYKDHDKEITTSILQKGDVFGELAMISEEKRKDFAQAMNDVVICVMDMTDMKKLMKDDSSITLIMMKMMGSRVVEMEQRLESLVFKDSKTRILEFIVRSVQKNGQRIGYEWILRNFITHKDIASLTATSRQTVTMVLNELKNENIIHFDRKRLLVRDLDKLINLIS